jgi:hypothetical protein
LMVVHSAVSGPAPLVSLTDNFVVTVEFSSGLFHLLALIVPAILVSSGNVTSLMMTGSFSLERLASAATNLGGGARSGPELLLCWSKPELPPQE